VNVALEVILAPSDTDGIAMATVLVKIGDDPSTLREEVLYQDIVRAPRFEEYRVTEFWVTSCLNLIVNRLYTEVNAGSYTTIEDLMLDPNEHK
jgi:hypothetical protein